MGMFDRKHVGVAAFIQRGALVLVRERIAGCDVGEYGPPGGKVEPGESVGAALVREVREETGCATDGAHLLATLDTPWGIVFLFRVSIVGTPLNTEQGKCPWTWLNVDTLRHMSPTRVQGSVAYMLGLNPPRCAPVDPLAFVPDWAGDRSSENPSPVPHVADPAADEPEKAE